MALSEQIEQQKTQLSGERYHALEKFLQTRFPTKKDEEYKYTNLAEIINKTYNLQPGTEHTITRTQLDALHFGEENFDWIVFVNGKLQENLSKITSKEIVFCPFAEIANKKPFQEHFNKIVLDNAFTDLNQALAEEGFLLYVPKGVVVEKPIHVFYLSEKQTENTFYNLHNLLVAEAGSKIEIVESHHNYDPHYVFTNTVTEIFAAPNAHADWHKLQNDTEKSYLIDHTFAKQERDSTVTVNTFSFGGKLVRNNLDFIHNGEHINSFMNGITIIGGDQLVDHHTAVHHKFPNCESYQNYKGIFKDKSHGVFNGKVYVDKIAQKTNAYQQNNNILLDEGASIDTKPQLEIFADDVKCSHGCTVGQLNEEAMFYLRARGISKKEAQALLLYAFANNAMQNIDIEELRTKISQILAEKLNVDLIF